MGCIYISRSLALSLAENEWLWVDADRGSPPTVNSNNSISKLCCAHSLCDCCKLSYISVSIYIFTCCTKVIQNIRPINIR